MGDVAVAKEMGDVTDIALVSFDFIAGLALSLGRRHEGTIQALLDQMAGDDEAGGSCLVADFESLKLDFKLFHQLFHQLLEGICYGSDTAGALPVVSRVLAAPSESVGDGNCFLVDV